MPPTDGSDAARYLFAQINAARAAAGAAPLCWNDRLAALAHTKAADMRDHQYFDHISPSLGSPLDMMLRAGIDPAVWAENLARVKDAEQAHAAFMESPRHRRNRLSPACREVGIGCVADGRMCIVVELFAALHRDGRQGAGSMST